MSRLRLVAAAAIGIVLLAPSAANAATPAAGGRITVDLVSSGGSGCPIGSTTVAPTASGEAFTLIFSDYQVRGGATKNCVSVVRVTAPAGWTYGVISVVSYGFAQLQASGTGKFSLLSRFTGFPFSFTDSLTLKGPYNDFWQRNNYGAAAIWAPCGGTWAYDMTLNSNISVTGAAATNSMAYHGQEVSVIYQLALRRC